MVIEIMTVTAMETEITETETTAAIEIMTVMETTAIVLAETVRVLQVQEEMTELLQHLRMISYLRQSRIQEDQTQERMTQERTIERRIMRQRKILSLLTASMRRSRLQSRKRRKKKQLSSLSYLTASL